MRRFSVLLIAAAFFCGCGTDSSRQQALELLAAEPDIRGSAVAGLVVERSSGRVLAELNSGQLMIPASTQKLLTAAAFLIKYGAGHRIRTTVHYRGQIRNGVLDGDLVVCGGGDPSPGVTGSGMLAPRDPFVPVYRALREAGIRRISGDLIAVDTVFDEELKSPGWNRRDLQQAFSAPVNGLSYRRNAVTVYVEATPQGKIQLRMNPDNRFLKLSNRVRLLPADPAGLQPGISLFLHGPANILEVRGGILPGQLLEWSCSLDRPTLRYLQVLQTALERHGIAVSGRRIDADGGVQLPQRELCRLYSPPAADLVRILLKHSRNNFAGHFIKLLGIGPGRRGSFSTGVRGLRLLLAQIPSLNPDGYVLYDGSGLHPGNRISPHTLVQVLRWMGGAFPQRELFPSALPVAGVDGTLRQRMENSPATGRVQAKTGTRPGVSCLAGYLQDSSGRELVFAVMVNGFSVSLDRANRALDRFCIRLVTAGGVAPAVSREL